MEVWERKGISIYPMSNTLTNTTADLSFTRGPSSTNTEVITSMAYSTRVMVFQILVAFLLGKQTAIRC